MDNSVLTWILIIAVILSLGFSAAALVIQIRRNNRQKKASSTTVKLDDSNRQGEPCHTPQQQPDYYAEQMQPQRENLVYQDDYDDSNEKTQSLFSSNRKPANVIDTSPGLLVSNRNYKVHISETAPAGVRTYEVIVDGIFSIGRAGANNLIIEDSTVSGQQCVLTANTNGVFIENKSGSNITQLNGAALSNISQLKTNDIIKIGKVQLLIINIYEIN